MYRHTLKKGKQRQEREAEKLKTSSLHPSMQMWSGPERLLALDELIDRCETSQVKHVMQVIEPQFQRDFISLLPKEVEPQDSRTLPSESGARLTSCF